MIVRISARASNDFANIYGYIHTNRGLESAERFLDAARRAKEFLAEHPEAGPHPQWTSRHKNLRFWVISRTNYIIYYFALHDHVSIERVLDGRRDVKRIIDLKEEDFDEAD
jgi:plasmid stabilization system protein ParE